uniref:Mucin n=1 Tax=Rhipicephalus appendiculatus TaxID=34631 RepID=A0A131YCI1_RHIAP
MQAMALCIPLLAALSSVTLCGLPPPISYGVNYACVPLCATWQRHGDWCGPNCTCRAHVRFRWPLMCVDIHSQNPFQMRPWRRPSPPR